MIFKKGDIVTFKFSPRLKETYNGIIVSSWKSKESKNVYEIASMNHSMSSYTIGESCIIKKIA